MAVATGLVCCLLLMQPSQTPASPNKTPAPPLREEAAGPLVPVYTPQSRQTPEQIIVDGLTPLEHHPLPGGAVSLLDALSRTVGRTRQREMIVSYWRVATATAQYRFRRDEFEQIQALAARATAEQSGATPEQSNRLLLEQASASARLRNAELEAVAAQTELAQKFGLPPGEPLPLAADAPLTGPYLTKLKELYAGRVPPPRLQLIDQLIPLRYEIVVARAEAVQAASDALQAVKDQYQRRELEGDRVAVKVADLAEQRAAFLLAVLEYNGDIAEYALATAPETATPAALLPTLIKVKPTPNGTPAQPQEMPPTSAPGDPPAADARQQARAGHGELRSVLVKPGETADDEQQTRLRVPTGETSDAGSDNAANAASEASETYARLVTLEPPKRTHRLTKLMHQDRAAAKVVGTPTSLSACLALAAPAQRDVVLEAYWRTRELAALQQSLADQLQWLASLEPIVLQGSAAAGGAEEMLLLRSRQADARADLLQTQATWLASRYELSGLVSRVTTAEQVLLPTTPPHGGRYQLRTDVQPRSFTEAHRIAELSDAVPDLHALLEDRSEAVTRADLQRGALVELYQQRKRPLQEVLTAVVRQTEETRTFLKTLTRYNAAIADYVLAVTPLTVPAPQLAAAMVVNPTR